MRKKRVSIWYLLLLLFALLIIGVGTYFLYFRSKGEQGQAVFGEEYGMYAGIYVNDTEICEDQSVVQSKIQLKSDGTFFIHNQNCQGFVQMKGTYQIAGEVITFTMDSTSGKSTKSVSSMQFLDSGHNICSGRQLCYRKQFSEN